MRREAFIIDLAPSKISVRYTDVYVTRLPDLRVVDETETRRGSSNGIYVDEIWSQGWKDIDALKMV
jgi:hypothetical protein